MKVHFYISIVASTVLLSCGAEQTGSHEINTNLDDLERYVSANESAPGIDKTLEFLQKYEELEIRRASATENALFRSWNTPKPSPVNITDAQTNTSNWETHFYLSGNDTFEKSVYFPKAYLDSLCNDILSASSSCFGSTFSYRDKDSLGYRIYFAKYPSNHSRYPDKFTAIARLTFAGNDIPYNSCVGVAVNLGNLCPPDCPPAPSRIVQDTVPRKSEGGRYLEKW